MSGSPITAPDLRRIRVTDDVMPSRARPKLRRVLCALSRELRTETECAPIYDRLARVACHTLHARRVMIYACARTGDVVHLVGIEGTLGPDVPPALVPISDPCAIAGAYRRFYVEQSTDPMDFGFMPVRYRGALLGVLQFERERALDEGERAFLQALAVLGAQALTRVRRRSRR